jgi:hypothetical protein
MKFSGVEKRFFHSGPGLDERPAAAGRALSSRPLVALTLLKFSGVERRVSSPEPGEERRPLGLERP